MIESFGQIRHDASSGRWYIRCEPHVRALLKRVLPRGSQQAAEIIHISDTPENCRQLEWFLARYPMAVDPHDYLVERANTHRAAERRVADLLAGHQPPLPFELAIPAREYQKVAAALLEVKEGLLVADDVGLGKTVTAICSMTQPENLPALVVCPTHLPRQWASQITRFAPQLSVHVVTKGSVYPIERAIRGVDGPNSIELASTLPDVLVINYHKLRGWAESLAGAIRFVVFDECQQLRSRENMIYEAARLVADRARRREGLSATPIYNYGSEFFWVIDAIAPGALGERAEFLREWCAGDWGGDKARIKDGAEFGAYLRREGIMLRRTREDVGRELPALTKVIHEIDADPGAIEKVKGDAAALARIIVGHNERYRGEKMNAAGELDNLMRQATGVAKAPYVAEFVRLLLESEERVVLFGWHRAVYAIWLEALAAYSPVLYTGSESPKQKAEALASFVGGRSHVLIMSLRSGAGVDGLQGSCRVVAFGELDWSPGVHEQCIGRVHRDGQSDTCTAYFLVSDQGADPIMTEVLGVKREQIEPVRNPDRPLVERIDTGENSIKRLARELLKRSGAQEHG